MIGVQKIVTKSDEIHKEIGKGWHSIFNQPETGSFMEFHKRYRDYIKIAKAEVGKLEAEKLMEAAGEMKDQRAIASDGWRVEEIKQLPKAIIDIFVKLFEDIEDGGEWPTFMEEVYTTMIEKEEDPDVMEVDAEDFLIPEPMGMRPINNFSPWYSMWSKVRFRDMEK